MSDSERTPLTSDAPPPDYQCQQPGQASGYGPSPNEPPPKYGPPPPGQMPQQGYIPQGPYPPQQQQPGYMNYPTGYQNQQPSTVVVVPQPVFGSSPVHLECPNCHALVSTAREYHAGTLTWLVALVICLFGLWLGCCLIPFCIDDLKDVEHICPNCGRHLGSYKRI